MGLPTVKIPSETIRLSDGQTLEVRGLTRGEALSMQGLAEDVLEVEVHLLAYGTDTPLDEARAWHKDAPASAVEPITSAVARLSGLLEDEAGRPTEKPSDEG
jgi:hypothetical protein